MTSRPHSRESHTSFPAGNNTYSSQTSERLGAFGTMQLETHNDQQYSGNRMPTHQRTHSQPQTAYETSSSQVNYRQQPQQPRYANVPQTHSLPQRHSQQGGWNGSTAGTIPRPNQLSVNVHTPRTEVVYQPTVSNADTSDTRRKYDKLSEVYSTSGDTVEFARNLGDYLNDRIPYGVTISILIGLSIIAFVMALIGTLNIPFCPMEPMIPIWLMVGGLLFIISAVFRIYHLIPSPRTRSRNLSLDLCGRVVELLFIIANIVWLILGCVWVYGSRSYVNFNEHMFEEHFCDSAVYFTAFAAVTGYLIFACLLIVAIVCLLLVGSVKENDNASQEMIPR